MVTPHKLNVRQCLVFAATMFALFATTVRLDAQSRLAIIGGTLIDVSDFGRSTKDLKGQLILCEDGKITRVGPLEGMEVPKGFVTIDARGKYIVPGLVDGFAVLNNQSYAQAYLAMGVTSILGVGGGRRGPMFFEADPGPTIYPLEDVGYEEKSLDDHLDRLQQIADEGAKVALLMYRLPPAKLRALAQRARELGLATIGELAQTKYLEGADCGIDAFVHTTRYSLGLASDDLIAGIAQEPFSNGLASPKWRYYRWLSELKAGDERIAAYAGKLAKSGAFLIPTAGLLYLHQPEVRNPWTYPVAKLLDAKDINKPADKKTGIPDWTPAQLDSYRALARASEHIEKTNRAAGCRYLAGSGTDVWGTMPGISLHTELEALVRFGMNPREALAAATSNFAAAYRWHELGAIQPGCRADILILNEDPRKDVRNLQAIHRVVAKGAVLDPKVLMEKPGLNNGVILDSNPWTCPERWRRKGDDYLDSVSVTKMSYRSNSLEVKGVIAQPRAPGKYPCVIYLRGGNREFGQINDRKIARGLARIASWGYAVVGSQYRGVDGGTGLEEFGGVEVNDVLNLIRLLEGLPKADTKRIGLYGGSRGGMMLYLAMKASDRFSGAVVRAGLADLDRWRRERPGIKSVLREFPGL